MKVYTAHLRTEDKLFFTVNTTFLGISKTKEGCIKYFFDKEDYIIYYYGIGSGFSTIRKGIDDSKYYVIVECEMYDD